MSAAPSNRRNSGVLFFTFGLFAPMLVALAFALVYGAFDALQYGNAFKPPSFEDLGFYLMYSYGILTVPALVSAIFLVKRRDEAGRISRQTALVFSFCVVTFWMALALVFFRLAFPLERLGNILSGSAILWLAGFVATLACCGLTNIFVRLFGQTRLGEAS